VLLSRKFQHEHFKSVIKVSISFEGSTPKKIEVSPGEYVSTLVEKFGTKRIISTRYCRLLLGERVMCDNGIRDKVRICDSDIEEGAALVLIRNRSADYLSPLRSSSARKARTKDE